LDLSDCVPPLPSTPTRRSSDLVHILTCDVSSPGSRPGKGKRAIHGLKQESSRLPDSPAEKQIVETIAIDITFGKCRAHAAELIRYQYLHFEIDEVVLAMPEVDLLLRRSVGKQPVARYLTLSYPPVCSIRIVEVQHLVGLNVSSDGLASRRPFHHQ